MEVREIPSTQNPFRIPIVVGIEDNTIVFVNTTVPSLLHQNIGFIRKIVNTLPEKRNEEPYLYVIRDFFSEHFGVITPKMEVIVPFSYDHIGESSEGFFSVGQVDPASGKMYYGLYDANTRQLVYPCKGTKPFNFILRQFSDENRIVRFFDIYKGKVYIFEKQMDFEEWKKNGKQIASEQLVQRKFFE